MKRLKNKGTEPMKRNMKWASVVMALVAAVAVGEGPGLGTGDVLGEKGVLGGGLAAQGERPSDFRGHP